MQEKCYNIGSGEGALQMQKLQRRAKNTGAWTHGDTEQREGHQRNDDNIRWFSVEALLGKKSPYTVPYFPVYFPFPPVFPCTGTRKKIYRKTLEQKSPYWSSFFLTQGEKGKGSQKRQGNSNSSQSKTKATAIRSVSTD